MPDMPPSTIDGVGDFSGGITTESRVAIGSERALMRCIDGFRPVGKALEPMQGSTQRSEGVIATPVNPNVVRVGSDTWIIAVDGSGNIRHIKASLADQSWSAVDADLTAGIAADARMARLAEQVMVPDTTAIKRFEPGYAGAHIYNLGIDPPVEGVGPELTMEGDANTIIVHNCDTVWDAIAIASGAVSNIRTAYDSIHSGTMIGVGMSGAVGTLKAIVATETPGANLNLESKTHLVLWINLFSGVYESPTVLKLQLYSDAECLTPLEAAMTIPPLVAGWQQITLTLPTPANLTGVKGIGLLAAVTSGYIVIMLDDIRAADVSFTTQWADTPVVRDYCYSFAGRANRGDTYPFWYYSLPSSTNSTLATTGPGQRIGITCNTGTVRDTCDVTHIIVWGKDTTATRFEYVGSIDITAVADETEVVFYDYGVPGVFNEELYLNEYLESRHTIPSQAKHIQATPGRLWALNLDSGARPLTLACSWYDKPWYWPTRLPGTADLKEGFEMEGFTIDAAEGRGLAFWQGQLFAFFDNELFIIAGDDWTNTHAVYVAGVGLTNRRSLATTHDRMIWLWDGEIYEFRAGTPQPIGKPGIDPGLIDTEAPMDACFWDQLFVLYCTYDGTPSLVIRDIVKQSWFVKSVAAMVGIGVDAGRLYGVTEGGYAVELMSNAVDGVYQEWSDEGAYADMGFSVGTRLMQVAAPGGDRRFSKIEIDMDCDEQDVMPAVTVSANTTGLKRESLDVSEDMPQVTMRSEGTRHELAIAVQGEAIDIGLDYMGSAPPARINFIGFERNQVTGR